MGEAPLPEHGLHGARTFLEGQGLPRIGGHRLVRAKADIEDGGVSVVSFDVFDTLLWRRVPRPTDTFVILGKQLLDAGLLRSWVDPLAFRRLRIAAEKRARSNRKKTGGGVEVNLDEIWSCLPKSVVLPEHRDRAAELEYRVERDLTQPDLDVAEFAAFAKERGCHLIIVSNTYFPNDRMARFLARPGLEMLHKATMFASCSFGVGKGDGLWKVVLQDLGVAPGRVLHVGDNEPADVDAPSELGIRTVLYPQASAAVDKIFARENLTPEEPKAPAEVVDPTCGDLGLTRLRAKVANRVESTSLSSDAAVSWEYGASVLGPVLTGFAEWVHRRTLEAGASTAWCMMREGAFLADLVQASADRHAKGVSAKPIWLSRQVTARAALDRVDEKSLRKMLVRRIRPTVGQFVEQLGLSANQLPHLPAPASASMDVPSVADDVISYLEEDEASRAVILTEAAAARRRLLGYLEATWGSADEPIVLVDLGWGGTIQRQLRDVFHIAGLPLTTVGLYLATNEVAAERVLDGAEISGYLTSLGEPERDIYDINRSPEVIEQSCLATLGSVVDFDTSRNPVLDGSIPAQEQVVSKLLVQDGVRAFQREWLRYDAAIPDWPSLDGSERTYLRNVLRTSVVSPTSDEARVFGAWAHEDNFGADTREYVVPPRLVPFVPYLSPLDLVEMTMEDALWPLGLAAAHDPGLARAALAIQAEQLPPDVFESQHSDKTSFFVDVESGFVAASEKPLRVNHNGLSFGSFRASQPGTKGVLFVPCHGHALIRIDWIELDLRDHSGAPPTTIRIDREDQFAGFAYSGCRWLTNNLVLSFTDQPGIRIPLPRVVGHVEGRVGFAVMSTPNPVNVNEVPGVDASAKVMRVLARARQEREAGGAGAIAKGALRKARGRLS